MGNLRGGESDLGLALWKEDGGKEGNGDVRFRWKGWRVNGGGRSREKREIEEGEGERDAKENGLTDRKSKETKAGFERWQSRVWGDSDLKVGWRMRRNASDKKN
jgi:hypothetical protein